MGLVRSCPVRGAENDYQRCVLMFCEGRESWGSSLGLERSSLLPSADADDHRLQRDEGRGHVLEQRAGRRRWMPGNAGAPFQPRICSETR